MKLKPLLALPLLLLTLARGLADPDTSFFFNGELDDGGTPANGEYNFIFTLFDHPTGGNAVGTPTSVVANGVAVNGGQFVVPLDFGKAVFNGSPRWLRIEVKTNLPAASHTTLAPRQTLGNVPYAVFAAAAGSVSDQAVTASAIAAAAVTPDKLATASPPTPGQVLSFLGGELSWINAPAGNDWSLLGNGGTVPGTSFLGTTDNVPLTLRVNNAPALRLQPTGLGPSLVGGHPENTISGGSSVIAGGGIADWPNSIVADWSAIVGGRANVVQGRAAIIGGGEANLITQGDGVIPNLSEYSVISGGRSNRIANGFHSAISGGGLNEIIDAHVATLAGGYFNRVRANAGTVGGGSNNEVNGDGGTVPGGFNNAADGDGSFAAGQFAKAQHNRAFVWSDGSAGDFASTADSQFLVSAAGGMGINKNNPTEALDVNGNVKAVQFIGDGSLLTGIGGGGGTGWSLLGNSGTDPLINFLGTSDNQPLEFRVNNQRALRIDPAPFGSFAPTITAGHANNLALGPGATVLGGGQTANPNIVNGQSSVIGGGDGNRVTSSWATIAGGSGNLASGQNAFVGGGGANKATGVLYATIAGGAGNIASGESSFVGGGSGNSATARGAVVGGGSENTAGGLWAVVGGGDENVNDGGYGFIGAGTGNNIGPSLSSAIAGGYGNLVSESYSSVGGGRANVVRAAHSAIAGGAGNEIASLAQYALLGGGLDNEIAYCLYSVLGGGNDNSLGGNYGFLGGGIGNINGADKATLGGGEQNTIQPGGAHATIGGGHLNEAALEASTIGGGAQNRALQSHTTVSGGNQNVSEQALATVGGGYRNRAANVSAAVLGGEYNVASGYGAAVVGGGNGGSPVDEVNNLAGGTSSFVGCGLGNEATGHYAAIVGGIGNEASGEGSFVGGGEENTAGGAYAAVPGGRQNSATGQYAFAAGQRAEAVHNGAFVWADSQAANFASTAADQFNIRAQGGVRLNSDTSFFLGNQYRQMVNLYNSAYGIGVQTGTAYFRSGGGFSWYEGGIHSDAFNDPGAGGTERMRLDVGGLRVNGTVVTSSDRSAKENFQPVNPRAVLDKVVALPLSEWNYKQDAATRHVGPMAQDFHAAFGLGPDDKHIATVDADGVALAAIQGLNEKLEAASQNAATRTRSMEAELSQKDTKIAELQGRLEALERLLKVGVNGGGQ